MEYENCVAMVECYVDYLAEQVCGERRCLIGEWEDAVKTLYGTGIKTFIIKHKLNIDLARIRTEACGKLIMHIVGSHGREGRYDKFCEKVNRYVRENNGQRGKRKPSITSKLHNKPDGNKQCVPEGYTCEQREVGGIGRKTDPSRKKRLNSILSKQKGVR